MLYYSTNHSIAPVSFKEALFMGQAPDKGLFMPSQIPLVSKDFIKSLVGQPYWKIAYEITSLFVDGEIPSGKLMEICKEAYDFGLPIEFLEEKDDNKIYIFRQDRGPTCAFKDFAARWLARVVEYFLDKDLSASTAPLHILAATSGDTGSAVGSAFCGRKNIKVTILFPPNEVSATQRKLMTTLGQNVTALGVNGKFDDCQKIVKMAFADPDLVSLNLSSANSINFGRLLPQIVYYFYLYTEFLKDNPDPKLVISIPSGNFGNIMGGIFAKQMGLPIHTFIASTNSNNAFTKFVQTNNYQPIAPSKECVSNAMNVGNPSNLIRIVETFGGNSNNLGQIKRLPDMEKLKHNIVASSWSDEDTAKAMQEVYSKYNVVLEPHGAVGYLGLIDFLKKTTETDLDCVVFETAHPAKFPEEVKSILGIDVPKPQAILDTENLPEKYETIEPSYEEFKQYLLNK
jgi:threonine synthase